MNTANESNLNPLLNSLNKHIKRYHLISRIDSGNFGTIFKCYDTETKTEAAMKVERTAHLDSISFVEYNISRTMGMFEGFPRLFGHGFACHRKYLVMELLGQNLKELLMLHGGTFSEKTVVMIAIEGIKRLRDMHNQGFIHRDIKPDNFLIGRNEHQNSIYLIDFSLAKNRIDTRSGQMLMREPNTFVGTVRFASINAHRCLEQSRRDDLISFTYLLIYLLKGRLPWQGLQITDEKEKLEIVEKMKSRILSDECFQELPEEMKIIFTFIYNLDFETYPDYSSYIETLHRYFARTGQIYDSKYDWST